MGTYNKLMITCEELKESGGVIERKLHSMGGAPKGQKTMLIVRKKI
jgi:hypothetical protein